jgi:hypothetical protein
MMINVQYDYVVYVEGPTPCAGRGVFKLSWPLAVASGLVFIRMSSCGIQNLFRARRTQTPGSWFSPSGCRSRGWIAVRASQVETAIFSLGAEVVDVSPILELGGVIWTIANRQGISEQALCAQNPVRLGVHDVALNRERGCRITSTAFCSLVWSPKRQRTYDGSWPGIIGSDAKAAATIQITFSLRTSATGAEMVYQFILGAGALLSETPASTTSCTTKRLKTFLAVPSVIAETSQHPSSYA